MSETLGLKNVNLLSKEQYSEIAEPSTDELWAISGSGFGFPSDRYIDLELGASGTSYTAPANGYFSIKVLGLASGKYMLLDVLNEEDKYLYALRLTPSGSTTDMEGIICAKKGYKLKTIYSGSNSTEYFRFIYAEGE